ncbi:hypothetical protein ABZ897_57405 [Nonomuraea sp. NPDC046802]|uniref:hypothetical protein n=1 Tax=Nonomuraea sp. NPDC046802 TaxID=3154919 RepID=UPI0033DB6353
MTTLSNPTLGLLIEIADQAERFGPLEVETLLMRADLQQDDFRPDHRYYEGTVGTTQGRMRYWVHGAREAALAGDLAARRALLAFARLIVEKTLPTKGPQLADWVRDPSGTLLGDLSEALLTDGYDLRWEGIVIEGRWEDVEIGCYRLVPTDATPTPLAAEINALERELELRGYMTVLNHYRQAEDGLANHKYESANGDLRTTLEDLVTRLAEDHTGYQREADRRTGQPRASQGGAAINHMVDCSALPADNGGKHLQGLWSLTHPEGSHPGTSSATRPASACRSSPLRPVVFSGSSQSESAPIVQTTSMDVDELIEPDRPPMLPTPVAHNDDPLCQR